MTGGQVHNWLLANNHYIHGAYILEIVKNQWEHNTIKGDSFIPYPGCSLLGHTACSIDSSSLVIFGGCLESTSGLECVNTFWDVATDAKQKLHSSQLPLPTPSGAYSTTFKLLVVGDAGVGKTCLITRFVDDVFSSTCKSTIGVDFKATTMEMDGKAVQLQVWDTAGQERFRALTTSYYRGAHGVILVYDVTEQASFDHLASWIKDVDLYSGEEVTKLLIGNKDDGARPKVVDTELAREFAKVGGIALSALRRSSFAGLTTLSHSLLHLRFHLRFPCFTPPSIPTTVLIAYICPTTCTLCTIILCGRCWS